VGAKRGGAVAHGWKSESGFLPYRWLGYCEALLLYALGLGSSTHPLPPAAYDAWLASYDWRDLYGQPQVYACRGGRCAPVAWSSTAIGARGSTAGGSGRAASRARAFDNIARPRRDASHVNPLDSHRVRRLRAQ
jgi:hypothetical protein